MLILRKFLRDIPAVAGLAIVLLVVLLAVFGPLIAPYPGDITAAHLARRLAAPSAQFPFGTDDLGRDMLSRSSSARRARSRWRCSSSSPRWRWACRSG